MWEPASSDSIRTLNTDYQSTMNTTTKHTKAFVDTIYDEAVEWWNTALRKTEIQFAVFLTHRANAAVDPALALHMILAQHCQTQLNDHRLQGGGFGAKSWLRTEVLRSRFSDLKVLAPVVGFGAVLVFQVLHDDFIRYVPAAGDEVSAPTGAAPRTVSGCA